MSKKAEVGRNTHYYRGREKYPSKPVYQRSGDLHIKQGFDQEMNVRVVRICVAKLFPDLPMPIGEETISESKKNAQY